jgi:hydrogenase maturation protease
VPRVRVIACGNPDAADDALAVLALREAAASLSGLPGVELVELLDPLRLLELLEDVDGAVLVDAVRTPGGRRRPGTLVRLGRSGWSEASAPASLSSHGLGLLEAVALASALGRVPAIVILGLEASDTTLGRAPTRPVAAAIPRLAGAIVSEVRAMLWGTGRPGPGREEVSAG